MRSSIVDIARRYIGTKFRHQGRSSAGLDCVGLLVMIAQELDLTYYDQPNYERRTTGIRFVNAFREAGLVQKPLTERQPGDVIIFRELRQTCHVAVLASGKAGETIVHSYASRRKVVEELYGPHWVEKSVGCYAFPGVD